jgi:hypothetical protein
VSTINFFPDRHWYGFKKAGGSRQGNNQKKQVRKQTDNKGYPEILGQPFTFPLQLHKPINRQWSKHHITIFAIIIIT